MAASLIQNALKVNFDSVLSFPDEGMVQIFKSIESTGLRGFLDCPSVIYEYDFVAFFAHSFVRENEIISCVQRKFVRISEDQFAGAFGLPTEGLTSMDEVPKDLIYDARSVFSASGEPVKTSCKKKEMKIEFLIQCGLKINRSKILFEILKDMVTRSSNQAKGFAANICVLRKGALELTLGEAKTFPPMNILTVKTIQLEQVRTRDDLVALKDALSSKITYLEMAFAHASTHQERVFRNQIFDVQQEIKTQNAALSQDLNEFRKETQDGINTLIAQLSEIIAYINRWRHDKKEEESSRGPPPDDRNKPGIRSEPPKRGGVSNRGGGSKRRRNQNSGGFNYWFGGADFSFSVLVQNSCT
ncbi:phospholipase D alpha 1-like [Dorcoceras hygrometricum]|uniref:Phospholipase D alpha 1-like n=1 Tax=Dorcoceras hygrometricum TaxID=472368 RepID=A0A2Z7AGA5_9LAMI|nr:phospholipase D alpha 1-like [Dorcoceras hygrometricum]